MRLVLDTNVVLSGIFFGGVPGRILTAWSEGRFHLVLSPEILDEYAAPVMRPHPGISSGIQRWHQSWPSWPRSRRWWTPHPCPCPSVQIPTMTSFWRRRSPPRHH